MSKMGKPRLGRGLSSLIKVSEEAPAAAPAPVPAPATTPPAAATAAPAGPASPATVSVTAIRPNPHQPRRLFNEASLAELAASIRTTGVIQPLVVRRSGTGYELIAGERRLRAAKLAGLSEIPAIIRDVDSFTQAQMALIENIQREDLNPIDRAQGYRTLVEQLGLTQNELATRLGEERSTIANFLRLLDLAEPVRDLLRNGKLSVGHAKLLAGVSDRAEQERLAGLVVAQDLSVRNLERLLQTGEAPPPKNAPAPASAHLSNLEKNLTRQLGMRVQLRTGAKKGRGKLVIHYSSLDQFDDLLGRLGVEAAAE
jgi:ParB family chromosome partitioning protein